MGELPGHCAAAGSGQKVTNMPSPALSAGLSSNPLEASGGASFGCGPHGKSRGRRSADPDRDIQ